MSGDIIVTAIIKGDHRYIVLCTDATRGEALRTVGRWAADQRLSFSWYDAALASRAIRNGTAEAK